MGLIEQLVTEARDKIGEARRLAAQHGSEALCDELADVETVVCCWLHLAATGGRETKSIEGQEVGYGKAEQEES